MQFVLAAGGTGGHMIPAYALAAELRSRGHGVLLITDERGKRYPGLFEGMPVEVLQAGRITKNPINLLKGVASILAGRRAARALYRRGRPDAVIGFGGYPAFPALLAAASMDIPTVLHEQNAVLGRVNRLLAGGASAIATAYERIERLKPAHQGKCVLVGNPVREAVVRLGEQPFPPFDEFSPLKILITGGSQGATVLGRVVPRGFAALEPSLRHRLQIVQQCRPDDIELVREAYRQLGIPAELTTYIEDMPAKLGDAHLVIGRAGASTIAELTAAGRPAILIPLPIATDDHQTANAREMARAGGARMIPQGQFRPDTLARQIEALAADPEALSNAAARALSVGRPRAAQDLADLVERIANKQAPLIVGPAASPASVRLAPAGAAA
ncbi:undecaprenyldiphospho-muramoylpentapeptide beta-N-acetylglucosaminyltransferase [Sphingomonas sp. BN140010]|uniref:UDP-N-acetylglucosamine--N-acetylmuramyl-(pentapeptide) pyrophosphoryl-undecaprenol N-acetylglucosamine transferase n=1 Tax=Sphingomonas arvum TaxID=2992113 RepID=A0ABT3JGX7_9SPHN|nr:undecaprenyldiphospho-muramoylpentapeptide beta-N-acetylglucosaminyltransferase [Sphingomonas sp. BN140010]MCW3798333.1 undecaprenyldiphospho-muramoylpentapeptide beta-N-acetylglucosaminyltransferase [Sphingomonas sp. BN140010]